MKLIHISDLHLGKRVNEISMLDEQRHILERITEICAEEKPAALLIAGDIYDKPVPPSEAVALFDGFVSSLAKMKLKTFIISGNHDSAERIAFGSEIMSGGGIYLSPVYSGKSEPIRLEDEFGDVLVYMLPFLRPSAVRPFFPECEINSYDDAVRAAVGALDNEPSARRVIIAHQFVTGARRSESEVISAGGLDNIGSDIFDGFDYAALGHIHSAQSFSGGKVRYSGTPLKYSFSEASDKKSLTVVTLAEKGNTDIRTVSLEPLHDMREIKGSYAEVVSRDSYNDENRYDYLHVTLTDEEDIPDAILKLRIVYPNIMKLDYDNSRTRAGGALSSAGRQLEKTPMQLFGDFFNEVNGTELSPLQREYVSALFASLEGEE